MISPGIVLALTLGAPVLRAPTQESTPEPAPKPYGLLLEREEAEAFLKTARVTDRVPIGTGVTGSERLTLTDGTRTLRAAWKTVDIFHAGTTRFQDGTVEVDFRDSYKSEIAAYELDKLLSLHLVPPVVERSIDGKTGSLQLWVEKAMTGADRKQRGEQDRDPDRWNEQIYKVRLLQQLTYNTDFANISNILVDPEGRVYAIDFSRAFRTLTFLMADKDLSRFSRGALDHLAELNEATLMQKLGRWLQARQISGLLKRRDKILALAHKLIAEKGEAAVLYP